MVDLPKTMLVAAVSAYLGAPLSPLRSVTRSFLEAAMSRKACLDSVVK
jgi:hypothetical protein